MYLSSETRNGRCVLLNRNVVINKGVMRQPVDQGEPIPRRKADCLCNTLSPPQEFLTHSPSSSIMPAISKLEQRGSVSKKKKPHYDRSGPAQQIEP